VYVFSTTLQSLSLLDALSANQNEFLKTQAGDPLEATAILNTIGHNRTSGLYVGSVKTNIGHLEGAAGVAGVIKAALLVERGLIPKNLW
jgi:acyl transferase domain-containing protein